MKRICLDQHTTQIQLRKQLLLLRRSLRLEHGPLMVLPCGVACLGDRQTESSGVERHLGNVDAVGRRPYTEPPPAVDTIEPRKVLPSHTS